MTQAGPSTAHTCQLQACAMFVSVDESENYPKETVSQFQVFIVLPGAGLNHTLLCLPLNQFNLYNLYKAPI